MNLDGNGDSIDSTASKKYYIFRDTQPQTSM